ncbi:interleukin-17 receptor E-like protein isoform 2-T2 [Aulostomus maculatus]
MILLVSLLLSPACLGLCGAAAEHVELERIETCSTKCSQGLRCKTKPEFFPPPCQKPTEDLNASSLFQNISLSTVMSCEGRQKCSLHLRIKATLQLTGSVWGMSVCTQTAGMLENCRSFSIQTAARGRKSGLQVQVENDCSSVSPKQQVQVTIKSFPNYCGVMWSGTYDAPGCSHEDLRKHIPVCITGRLSYDVDPEKKELNVTVTDMLEDYDYQLRLCHNDFVCFGTDANTVIKKEESIKSATLLYSRPLPCLCIEGWSITTDATRVQVCPFKDNLEELWQGITFDPQEEALLWEPACPVTAVVTLCQRGEDGVCLDLPRSMQNVSREKITFSEVDMHPQLCMKFTARGQSWTRCPFVDGRFRAWKVALTKQQGRQEVKITSLLNATFSVGLCVKSAASPMACQMTETHTVNVEEDKPFSLNLAGKLCDVNYCLQVTRLHVKHAATVIQCFEQCNQSQPLQPVAATLNWTSYILPVGVCLLGIVIITLVLHVLLTVHQKKNKQTHRGYRAEAKQTGKIRGGVFLPSCPQCTNTEKANLLYD